MRMANQWSHHPGRLQPAPARSPAHQGALAMDTSSWASAAEDQRAFRRVHRQVANHTLIRRFWAVRFSAIRGQRALCCHLLCGGNSIAFQSFAGFTVWLTLIAE